MSSSTAPDQTAHELQRLLRQIIQTLVDDPSRVEVECGTSPDGMSFQVHVAPADVGKVIGKQGRTARSLRVILSAAGMKLRKRLSLDIVEEDRPGSIRRAESAGDAACAQ